MASHVDDGIAIDCEMVQIDSGKQVLAHVCAVGWDEAVLLNTYVDPGAPVKDYLTRYSGLRPGDLDGAPSFDSVQSRVAALLDGRVLVGHSPSNDLKALRLKHPAELTRDTATLDWGPRERGLGTLAREVLGFDIQGGTHSPEEDALASLRLLKYFTAHGPPPLRTVPVVLAYAAPVPRPTGVPCAVEAAASAAAGAGAAADGACASSWTLHLPWSRQQREGLLKWFKKARQKGRVEPATAAGAAVVEGAAAEAVAGAAPVALAFPASLSKTERGMVFREAQHLRLPTESSGVDEERFIRVLATPPAAAAAPPPRLLHVATVVYRWVQEIAMDDACDANNEAQQPQPKQPAGVAVARQRSRPLSLGEVIELLSQGRALPPPYGALRARAEGLLEAAGSTIPTLDAGTSAAERVRRDWVRVEWYRSCRLV